MLVTMNVRYVHVYNTTKLQRLTDVKDCVAVHTISIRI